tara:strand:+ start:2271 stop:2456 length:186 start_codon:yes stop_codon:yes gene_type:complete
MFPKFHRLANFLQPVKIRIRWLFFFVLSALFVGNITEKIHWFFVNIYNSMLYLKHGLASMM